MAAPGNPNLLGRIPQACVKPSSTKARASPDYRHSPWAACALQAGASCTGTVYIYKNKTRTRAGASAGLCPMLRRHRQNRVSSTALHEGRPGAAGGRAGKVDKPPWAVGPSAPPACATRAARQHQVLLLAIHGTVGPKTGLVSLSVRTLCARRAAPGGLPSGTRQRSARAHSSGRSTALADPNAGYKGASTDVSHLKPLDHPITSLL